MSQISPIELFAFGWFLVWWVGYTAYSDRAARKGTNLVGAMARQREQWMRQMVGRDNRMVDVAIVRNLIRTSSFFASTSMLILAGLIAALGASEKAVRIVATVPLVSELSSLQWEMHLLALILIFIYAFFKFTWSIRQLSYCSIQIGAMVPSAKADPDCFRRSDCIARIATLGGRPLQPRPARLLLRGGAGGVLHPSDRPDRRGDLARARALPPGVPLEHARHPARQRAGRARRRWIAPPSAAGPC